MLRPHEEARAEFEIICLEDFIPEDHLLRKIAAHIDFSFIHNIVKDLYSESWGRPAIDPVLLISRCFSSVISMGSAPNGSWNRKYDSILPIDGFWASSLDLSTNFAQKAFKSYSLGHE